MSEHGSDFANAAVRAPGPIRVILAGCGAIGLSRHLPALRSHPRFELVALVDPREPDLPEPRFRSLAAALAAGVEPEAVAIATPPQVRAGLAREALAAGLAVLLEKPPAATVAEARGLSSLATDAGVTLFAAWHSRFAPMVATARDWLHGHRLVGGRMSWREDVDKWHPGQDWIWRPGGMGVFDPGMNGFSLLTLLHPHALEVAEARFRVSPGAQTPVAAELLLRGPGFRMPVTLDFQARDGETWRLELQRDDGRTAVLDAGGARWCESGGAVLDAPDREYEAVYHRFAALVEAGESEVDLRPLELVEAAFARAATGET